MRYFLIFIIVSIATVGCKNSEVMKYKNPDLSVNERVDDLISRMTLEEKVAQMVSVNNEVKYLIIFKSDGSFDIKG